MDPSEEPCAPGTDRGPEAEALLWNLTARLRSRGWQISLWEIQRAQDVIAYLFTRLRRPPTDEELLRHLRPVFCSKDTEMTMFAEVFRESVPTRSAIETTTTRARRRRPTWRLSLALVAALVFGVAVLRIVPPARSPQEGGGGPPGASQPDAVVTWSVGLWALLAVACAATITMLVWSLLNPRLRRRPPPGTAEREVELRWAIEHPLDTIECARTAQALRTWTRERGEALDVQRTVEASIRAGMRLTPRFVMHRRSPEYLAVIEQRSTHDLLATHHARIVDQIRANGVAMRRVALQPRTRLIIDAARGRRPVDTLEPTSERERLLLFAGDRLLRDPLSGDSRPWLRRFGRWRGTTQITTDVGMLEPLPVVDRTVPDVRAIDPEWARTRARAEHRVLEAVPAVFEADDERWIEAVAPSTRETTRALELLGTALGDAGWFWLGACALYPEIRYDLTVSLGLLLMDDDGEPLAAHADIAVLARLPWFRHAFMPDWLRATLMSTMPHDRLVRARGALDQLLVGGLVAGAGTRGDGLALAESRPGGPTERSSSSGPTSAGLDDRVYLDGLALRRRHLATVAPRELVSTLRRRRHHSADASRSADAPSLRVRRALAWCNALLLVVAALSPLTLALQVYEAVSSGSWEELDNPSSTTGKIALVAWLLSTVPAIITVVFSSLAGQRRGVVVGGSWLAYLTVLLSVISADFSRSSAPVLTLGLLAVSVLVTSVILVALRAATQVRRTPWVRFAHRNELAFRAGLVLFAFSAAAGWAVSGDGPLRQPATGSVLGVTLQVAVILGVYGSVSVVLAAGYFAGVRFAPLLVGTAIGICAFAFTVQADVERAVLFGLPTVVFLVGVHWQLRRVRGRPPLDYWDTAWREWKWPIALGVVAATASITWYYTHAWQQTLLLTAFPAVPVVLNLVVELFGAWFARFAARHRLYDRYPLHVD